MDGPLSKTRPRRVGPPVFIVAGDPMPTEDHAEFFTRLFEAASALARATFSRGHPVVTLGDERLLPILLTISTEYQAPDLAGPWVLLYGEQPEQWKTDFADWERAGLAKQNFKGNEAQALDALARTGEVRTVFALGGGGQAERAMRRLRAEETFGPGRRPLFFIRSVGGAGELPVDGARDTDVLKEIAPSLREFGLEMDETASPDEMALFYPLIMQTFLDHLDG